MHDRRQLGLVIYRAATDLAAKAALFLITIAAARTLAPASFGLLSLAMTVGWMVAVAGDFGIQMHLARAVAQQPAAAPHLLRRWLPIRALTALLGVITVALGASIAVESWAAVNVLLLFTLVYAVNGLVEFLYYFYRGLGRTDLESTLVLGQRLAVLLLALAVLRWAPSLPLLAAAMLAPAIGALLLAMRIARRLRPADAATGTHVAPVSSDAMDSVLSIGAGIVLSALYFRIDIFMIEAWRGEEAVGLYNAVFRIVEALRLLPAAVLAVVMPTLFTAATRRPLAQVALPLTGGAVVLAAAFWLTAGWLVPMLFGPSYEGAVPAFRVLILAFPLMTMNYALTHQLIGWHGHRFYALICALALVMNIAVNVLLIPALGIVGAAWTTLFTEMVVTAGCLVGLRRGTGSSMNGSHSPVMAVSR